MVVDFSVEDNPDSSVLIGHGLMAAGYVNNAEPPEAHCNRAAAQRASVVRPAVVKDIPHGLRIVPSRPATI